jgi:hypothetical protein
MKHVDILVSKKDLESLDDFARLFFGIAGIQSFEMRDSEHYEGGHYFIARTGDRTFKVMFSNSAKHNDLPFWLRLSSTDEAELLTAAEIDALAQKLVRAGYKVARVIDKARYSERRVNYHANG